MGRGLGEDLGENGRGDDHVNANGESHGPSPPPPPPPSMTHTEMMAEMLAARCESARALEMMEQAIGGFARGGPSGNGGNGGSACGLERPCSYPDFLETHLPTFTPTVEPLNMEYWLRILEQKF